MESFTREELEKNYCAYQFNISVEPEIKKFCQPFLDKFGLSYFSMQVFYEGRRNFSVSTNLAYQEYRFQKLVSLGESFVHEVQKAPDEGFHYYIWPPQPIEPAIEAFHQIGLTQSMSIYLRRGNESVENYCIAAPQREGFSLTNIFVNNIEIFKKFILCFRLQFKDLLNVKEEKKFFLFKKI